MAETTTNSDPESTGIIQAGTWLRSVPALRHRNFQLYISGQLVSLAGTWMQRVAQGWLVYQISRSEFTLGLVEFSAAVPALLISLWGGVMVDRLSKHTVLIGTQIASMLLALLLGILTFTGMVEVQYIIIIAALTGFVNALDAPARQAFVVEMVGKPDLPNAIALNAITFNLARVIGPALAGWLLITYGAGWCFTLNGASFLAVLASLLMMKLPRRQDTIKHGSPWSELRDGIDYVRTMPNVAALLSLALVLSLFGIAYVAVLPAYVHKVLGGGAVEFSWLSTAIGVGAIASVLIIATFGNRGWRGKLLVTLAITFPITLFIFAFTTWMPAAYLCATILGYGFIGEYVLINTLLQTQIVDAMRGRVLSLYTITFLGFTPFGSLMVGWLAEQIGLSITIAICAASTLILSAIILLRTPTVRHLP